MSTPAIIVTGGSGQLGSCVKDIADQFPGYDFHFFSHEQLPLDQMETVRALFHKLQPHYCINCAAYTAVDLAEKDIDSAFQINAEAVANLAATCKQTNTRFIHISTDYVFSGNGSVPYTEDDITEPVNVYGASKAKGETLALANNPDCIIIRTSWVYSRHGKNFVKTMLQLMDTRSEIKVVADQVGSPTYAADLAAAIMQMITQGANQPGIFHYCNKGETTWYAFATAIRDITGKVCIIHPIPTADYPTPAKRPLYTRMNTRKIESFYNITIPDWRASLENCLRTL